MSQPVVLLVDDDEDYLLIAGRAIQREEVRADIRVLKSGQEVLAYLGLDGSGTDARPANLVAAFVDLNLPGVNGWELLRRIRADERLKELPVIVVSSSARASDVRRSYDLGANSYVVKRYDPSGPGRYLARAIRYWTELNCVPDSVAASST
jgi:two-component system, response regulator